MPREDHTEETDRNPRHADEIYSIYLFDLDDGYAATEIGVDWEAHGQTRTEAIANYAMAIENRAQPAEDSNEVSASAD